MNGRWVIIKLAALVCAVVAVGHGLTFAADTPAGFDTGDDELGRRVTIIPSATPMPPLPATIDRMSTVRPARGNPLWGIPIESLHATRERPLFSPSRRSPMPAAIAAPAAEPIKVTAPAEPDQPSLNLIGVVVGGSEGYAVFLNNATHDIIRLKIGEGENGWILRSVTDRQAVLENDHRTAVVRLPSATGDQK